MAAKIYQTNPAVIIILLIICLKVSSTWTNHMKVGGLFYDTKEDGLVRRMIELSLEKFNKMPKAWHAPKVSLVGIQASTSDPQHILQNKICQLISQGVVALLGPTRHNNSRFIMENTASHLLIPHIQWKPSNSQTKTFKLTINMAPSREILCSVMISTIEHFQWPGFVYLYSSSDTLITVEQLIIQRSGLPSESHPIYLRKYNDDTVYSLLELIRSKGWNYIVVDLTLDETNELLHAALHMGMISRKYHFMLMNLDAINLNLAPFRHNFVNITLFTLKGVNFSQIHHDILSDSMKTQFYSNDQITTDAVLAYDSATILGKSIHRTLTNTQSVQFANISCDTFINSYRRTNFGLSLLNDLNSQTLADGLSGPVTFSRRERSNIELDIYHITRHGVEKIGDWALNRRIHIIKNPYDVLDVYPLKNKIVRVVTVLQDPFVQEKIDASKREGRDKYEGYCIEMMERIANASGFEWTIYVEKGNTYGTLENKNWTGMVKELLEGRADIALGAFTISYIREKFIDFTKPFMNLGISILFKKPKGEKPGLFSFLTPLATVIWLYVIASYMVVTLIIYTVARFSPYEWMNPHPCEDSDYVQNKFTLSNSCWFTLGTLLQQGSDVNPSSVSTRMVGGIWWIFTLIIISSYTANLAAFLTIEQVITPIENAGDLVRQDKIDYGALRGGSTMSFFKNSHIETYKKMWEKMSVKGSDVLTASTEKGIKRVKNSNYAFLMESKMIEYYKERDTDCELIQLGGLIDSKGYGIGVAPNLPGLLDELTLRILELQRDQILHVLENKWWRDSGTCRGKDGKTSNHANSLDINNVGGIFVVLCIGLAVGIFTALAEFIYKSKKEGRHETSIWREMAAELGFALSCYGSERRLKNTRQTKRHNSSYTHNYDMKQTMEIAPY